MHLSIPLQQSQSNGSSQQQLLHHLMPHTSSSNDRSVQDIKFKIEDIEYDEKEPPLKRQRLNNNKNNNNNNNTNNGAIMKQEVPSKDEIIECIIHPLATTPRNNNINTDFHPETSILCHLKKAKKTIKIAMAYWKSTAFSEAIKQFVSNTDELKNVQWKIILSAESIYNKEYFNATKILLDIAKDERYSNRFQCKIVHGATYFSKMHWKFVSIDGYVYYIGSWQPTQCASYQNEEIGQVIATKTKSKIKIWEDRFEEQWNYEDSMNLMEGLDIIKEQENNRKLIELQQKIDELNKSKQKIEREIAEYKKQILQQLNISKNNNYKKKKKKSKDKKRKSVKKQDEIDCGGRIVKFDPKFDFDDYFENVVPKQDYKINISRNKIKNINIGDLVFFQFDSHIRYISTVIKDIYEDDNWDNIKYPKCPLAFKVDKDNFITVRHCMRQTKYNKSRCYNKLSKEQCIELKQQCLNDNNNDDDDDDDDDDGDDEGEIGDDEDENDDDSQDMIDMEFNEAIQIVKYKAKKDKQAILDRVGAEYERETGIEADNVMLNEAFELSASQRSISDEINDNTLIKKRKRKRRRNTKAKRRVEIDSDNNYIWNKDLKRGRKKVSRSNSFIVSDYDEYDEDEDDEDDEADIDIVPIVSNSNNKRSTGKKTRRSRYNLRSNANESDDLMIPSDEDDIE